MDAGPLTASDLWGLVMVLGLGTVWGRGPDGMGDWGRDCEDGMWEGMMG